MIQKIINFIKNNKTPLSLTGIILYSLIIFYPNFLLYFHQDDFINFSLVNNFASVISSFNIFQPHPDFLFYRPIPVYLYFYIFKKLFGFNPLGFHLVNYVFFVLLILLVYRLVSKLTKKNLTALIVTTIFAINSTHFAAMASGAYSHEIIFSIFSVLTIYFFLAKNNLISLFFLILAFMSKETAVMLPPIISIILFMRSKSIKQFFNQIKILFPFFLILVIYLFGHFFYYGLPQSSSYQFILGKQNLNILAWYTLWSFSVPNILVDFIGPGLRINPIFFAVSGLNGSIFIYSLITFILSMVFLSLKGFQKLIFNNESLRLILIGLLWFILGLVPVLIFPLHKLAIEQSFPMIGLILSVSIIITNSLYNHKKVVKFLAILTLVTYVVLATNSIYLARRTHWITRSASQAKSVIDYFRPLINSLSPNTVLYFADGEIAIPEWGSSKQMYLALGQGKAINIIFNRPDLIVHFKSQNDPVPIEGNYLIINSSQFLGY